MGIRWLSIAGIATVVLTLAPQAARAGAHSDDQLGYSISPPNGWREIPIAGEEKYIVAKWQSDKEYTDPKEGWGGFRP